MRRPIVIGNWKLHGNHAFVATLLRQLVQGWVGAHRTEMVVCPAFVHLAQARAALAQSVLGLGAQDVSHFDEGAFTGDVSADMLHDLGCDYVIVGHSERRRHHGETNEIVARKFEAAQNARLVPILCVGETAQEREQGLALEAIDRQIRAVADHCGRDRLARAIVAYEPLWAVGTGKRASPEQAQEVHRFIRQDLGEGGAKTRIVYGGSVTPANAHEMLAMPDIDGALVGGASLTASHFLDIGRAAG